MQCFQMGIEKCLANVPKMDEIGKKHLFMHLVVIFWYMTYDLEQD